MRSSQESHTPPPRLVASNGATLAEWRRVIEAEGRPDLANKLLNNMKIVKKARFNAHERLEAKHVASVAAFTFATVVEIALSMFTVAYDGKLNSDVSAFLNFSSIVTGLFLFGFGLVVGLVNYQGKALYLQRCAMDLSNLADEMAIAMPLTVAELQEYRRRYHEIEAQCPTNHQPVDSALARADMKSDPAARRTAEWGRWLDIYGPYTFATVAYLTMWIWFWILLKG